MCKHSINYLVFLWFYEKLIVFAILNFLLYNIFIHKEVCMLDFKRLISMFLVLGFIANTKAANNNNYNISMHGKNVNNYLSKTE